MTSKLVETAIRKGYSGAELCRMVNRSGLRVHINDFRKAVRDDAVRSARQDMIFRTAEEILDSLPVRECEEDDFAARARRRGETVRSVWEHYNATREKKYAYKTFMVALRRFSAPFEVKLMREAEACLDEIASRKGN